MNTVPAESLSKLEQERKEILNAFRGLMRALKDRNKEETKLIRKAFDVALDAHKEMRRKSGEPYIYHPIAVARICAEEMGLGPTSVICALLHDTVEDTHITLEDVEDLFETGALEKKPIMIFETDGKIIFILHTYMLFKPTTFSRSITNLLSDFVAVYKVLSQFFKLN